MTKPKKIPYGESDFKKIQLNNYYYIDKTQFIESVEDSPSFLFLIRPRRFGKSLFLSVLECYYDVYYKDEFDAIFKDTFIGQNSTAAKNSFFILRFNFAEVDSRIEIIEKSFNDHCDNVFFDFFRKYESYFSQKDIEYITKKSTGTAKLSALFRIAKFQDFEIYIIIDEYDNFTNSILANYGVEHYEAITRDKSGFFKQFFNVIKAGTTAADAPISKLFITGVSPITLDDVTSGGIGHNITTELEFNESVGFTEEEVREMLNYYKNAEKIPEDIDTLMQFMKKWYNHYQFAEDAQLTLYNSTMVMNFMVRFMSSNKFPKDIIDPNTKIDYSKLRHLLILDNQLNGNFSVLTEIVEKNQIEAQINKAFSVKEITKRDNFISMLYYFGLITISAYDKGKYRLAIPNEAVKDFFTNYIKDGFDDAGIFRLDVYNFSKQMTKMAYDGQWKDVFLFLSQAVKEQSRIRDYIKGEAMIKGFLLAYLNITNDFIVTSEKELNKGVADLWLAPVIKQTANNNYSYLIELKYHKRTEEKNITGKYLQNLIQEAAEKLAQYENDPIVVKEKATTTLKKIVLVYNAWELVHYEEV